MLTCALREKDVELGPVVHVMTNSTPSGLCRMSIRSICVGILDNSMMQNVCYTVSSDHTCPQVIKLENTIGLRGPLVVCGLLVWHIKHSCMNLSTADQGRHSYNFDTCKIIHKDVVDFLLSLITATCTCSSQSVGSDYQS